MPTPKITTMNRAACEVIRQRLEALTAGKFDDLGCQIKIKGATFDPAGLVTFRVEVALTAADGTVMTKEASEFKACASLYGLEASDLGRTFQNAGHTFTIIGAKSRSQFPILVRRDDGKAFKYGSDAVKALLDAAAQRSKAQ